MSDNDSLSDYPSDLEYAIRNVDHRLTVHPIDSGIESNDGYLTDEIEHNKRHNKNSRNSRIFKKKFRRYLRQN